MLANYDAKAIAEVMGIAFLRSAKVGPVPTANTTARVRIGSKSPASNFESAFVICVDDAPMLIVEAKANNTFARFNLSKGRINRKSDFIDELVSSPSPAFIEKAVERGLPRQALRHVAERLAGGDAARASLLEWGVVPKTTLDRRESQLSPQESERTERVARVFVHARRALGTDAEAREFMVTPHPQLDERCPVDAARTDLGARRIEQILNALEYGLAL